MRFYYVALAVMATFLASASAVASDAVKNEVRQSLSETITVAETNDGVKRSLRYGDDEKNSVDSVNDNEERGGVDINDLMRTVRSKLGVIHLDVEKDLTKKIRKDILNTWLEQNISQKKFATKLGLNNINDEAARNYKWFAEHMGQFRTGKKVKKIPEGMIGDW
ncbi:RxLR effector protein [Phytophthora megakarya]|uniref:RxLR effector protein n=1 Tax=Phytophthora megakarya TaxID=4795 RepID=A0A225VRI4_9STRA|nr:RxLR effector protein [Phytophthora megakarya]